MFPAITSVGWGFNWPVTKYLLSELPPLTLRGSTGVIGAALLALLALARAQSLKVERHLWPRLMLSALLNVTGWMVLMGLALLWLPASEAALIAYTMPVWASLLAWPVLGERPTILRTAALVMAIFAIVTRRSALAASLRVALPAFAPAGVLLGAAYAALVTAFDRGRVGIVAPLNATQSLWGILFAALLFHRSEAIGRRTVVAGVLVVAGGAIVGAVR